MCRATSAQRRRRDGYARIRSFALFVLQLREIGQVSKTGGVEKCARRHEQMVLVERGQAADEQRVERAVAAGAADMLDRGTAARVIGCL
jgi:hypothetical protein